MPNAHAGSGTQANKELVLKVTRLLNVERKIDHAIDNYFTPDFIEHDPSSGTGAEAMRSFFKNFYAEFPKATLEVKRMIAEGDLVVVHFQGQLKPGDRALAGVEIYRVSNGKLAEHWQVMQEIPETSNNSNGVF